MVVTHLTSELIREGATLVEALDKAGVAPVAALWSYSPDSGAWRLLLADARFARVGPRVVYRGFQKTLHRLRKEITHLSLTDIVAAEPDAPILRSLARSVGTSPGINGIRFTQGVVNGMFVDDAVIYRLKRRAA